MRVCWNLTNKCNANCLHCFRNIEEKPLSLKEDLSILKKLQGCVDSLGFSGGEALLYDGFWELLDEANKLNIPCSLTTNAQLISDQNLKVLLNKLNRITFSLDFVDDEKNKIIGRGENYFKNLKHILNLLFEINPNFIVKVNTVITSLNYDDIDDIYKFLKNYNINTWKLLRFCPYRTTAKQNAKKLSISEDDFINLKKKVSKFYYGLNITVEDINDVENQLFITPEGNLCFGKNNEDVVVLPNLASQSKDAVKNAILSNYEIDSNKTDINLNLYKTFYTVAKFGSISAASKELYISQPAISKSIKKIESQLDVNLFNRTLNGVNLTSEGKKLFHYVDLAYNNLITAQQCLKETNNFSKGTLRIGTPSHIGTCLLFDKIKTFKQQFSDIKISIISRSTNDLINKLNNHEIDFIIDSVPIETDNAKLTIIPIKKIDMCFVYNNHYDYDIKNVKSLSDLQTKPLILPVSHASYRKTLDSFCNKYGVNLKNILNIETSEMTLNAVNQGLGIGYVLYDLVEKDIESQKLSILKLYETLPNIEVVLIYNEDYLTNVPKYFIENFVLVDKKL